MSCSCSGYPTSLPGWTRYGRYPDTGGDNTYLQHESGLKAADLAEARRMSHEMAAREEKRCKGVAGV